MIVEPNMKHTNTMHMVGRKIDAIGQRYLPVVLRRSYAQLFGYPWLRCSCGSEFGGFESRYCKVVMKDIDLASELSSLAGQGSKNHSEAALLCPMCSSRKDT